MLVMRRLDKALLRFFLPGLLARACPATVHRSGDEGMRVNCFNVVLPEAIRPRTVLVDITGSTIQGLEFDGQSHKRPVTIELDDIDAALLQVTHYYGLDEVRYEGIVHLALGRVTKWPYVLLHSLRVQRWLMQRWFNARQMKLGDRLTILKDVADLTSEGVQNIGALEVMSHRYGNHWAGHPGWHSFQERLDKQLQLLADAGDLSTSDNFSFRLTGQGVRTLDERRDASRKHGANWWMQLAGWVVALLALVFAAAQANFLKLPTVLDMQKADGDKAASPPSATASVPAVTRPASATFSMGKSTPAMTPQAPPSAVPRAQVAPSVMSR
jgi:hypothetical protein